MNLFRMTRSLLKVKLYLLYPIVVGIAAIHAFAASVLIVDKAGTPTPSCQEFKEAANFYGISTTTLANANSRVLISALQRPRGKILAVAIHADALWSLDQRSVTSALEQADRRPIPLLIFGVDEHTDPLVLERWSGQAISRSGKIGWDGEPALYEWSEEDIVAQLKGSELPIQAKEAPYLIATTGVNLHSIISVKIMDNYLPVFAKVKTGKRETFFATAIHSIPVPPSPSPYRQQSIFASLAPSLLFLHYVSGEYAWHTPGPYANFTIDDLWLRAPYGHVEYVGLLQEAEQHRFHTTIAFIPWNFDRSQSETTELFRNHRDQYSICVHGNNHVHQEFGPLSSHPLARQILDIKQALARMDKFSDLTKIPYDPVMVLPHSVSPVATFAALKSADYLATANSLNVPSDVSAPSGAEFALRTSTLQFANFPSLRRYSAETDIPRAQLAIDAFLGNPMLFYAHESFFAGGINAFDKTADTVNKLEPMTQWRSLGDIAQHLYLERLRDDGAYDVRALSSRIQLKNLHGKDAIFYVTKDEDFAYPLTLSIDGAPQPYVRAASGINIRLLVKAGAVRDIYIKYGGDPNVGRIDISKSSVKVNAIRILSDFRDNVVSKFWLGRRFIKSYADRSATWDALFAGVFLVCLSVLVCLILARRLKRQSVM